MILADFDRSVQRLASQPFQLIARVGDVALRRVPDYMLVTDNGPLIVDVKPSSKRGDPGIEDKLRLTKQVIESRGWRYEIASEPPDVLFANVRFLAGYRRDWLFGAELITAVKDVVGDASSKLSIRQVVQDAGGSTAITLGALMHLLWSQDVRADLDRRLTSATPVWAG